MLALPFVSACDSSGPGSVGNSASNESPEASFTASDAEPRAGEKVTFDASGSSDPDGDIENYLWDFGADGGSEKTGQQVEWRFEAADTTGVQLTVTDSDGAEVSTKREARVQPGVQVEYTYTPEKPRAGEEVTFDASSSEDPLGQIQSYEWDFDGDGSTDATGETAKWTFGYERGDSTSVSLTVTGEEDARKTAERGLDLLPLQIAMEVERPRITQSVQRYEGDSVPLVAGRDGLLRVFLSAGQDNPYSPEVQVRLFRNGMPVETLTASSDRTVPTAPGVGELSDSWNVVIPGELIQPGLSVLIESNSEDDIPLTDDGQAQFPADGEPLPLDVRDTPPLRLTMIPVEVSATGETGDVSEGNLETYLELPRDLFPISAYDTGLHATYTTDLEPSENFVFDLLPEIEAIRVAEESDRNYFGVFSDKVDTGFFTGAAYIGGKAAVGIEENSWITAHELGHNFDQRHAPCGDPANIDPDYPYPNADIGLYGVNVDQSALRPPSEWKDLMSYCGPEWISDYTYTRILNYRQQSQGSSSARRSLAANQDKEPVLLVWGSISDGKVVLEPAFEIDSSPKLPSGSGPYTLEGFDKRGGRLFSFSFSGMRVADGAPGERSFAFAIPRSRVGGNRLAKLEVSGNGASATLRSSIAQGKTQPLSQSAGTFSLQDVGRNAARLQWSDPGYQAVMVRDAQTGEVLSISRDGDTRLSTDGARTVKLLFSDGVRTTQKRARVR
jgi:PKD repeat protein